MSFIERRKIQLILKDHINFMHFMEYNIVDNRKIYILLVKYLL